MDSGEQRTRLDFAKENRDEQLLSSSRVAPALPQPTLPPMLHKVSGAFAFGGELPRRVPLSAFVHGAYRSAQDAEQPWRSSGGFGLANLLNRPSSTAAGSSSAQASSNGPLPSFSLPSLHTFGQLSKPDLPISVSAHHTMLPNTHTLTQRSSPPRVALSTATQSKPEAAREAPRSLSIHTSEPLDRHAPIGTSSPPSRETTPRKQNHNNNNNSARRIAPAPSEEEEAELDEELGGSIRGGRWTADEHERFLAGFRIHGHKWKRVQQVVRTRSVTQVRTHAQKYLLKVAKLKAEKKQGKAVDVSALNDRYLSGRGADSSSDVEHSSHTAPSSPASRGAKRSFDDSVDSSSSPNPHYKSTLRKKARQGGYSEEPVDVLDQEYIAAAATTLCFLMTQKIDSLFDTRTDMLEKDALEPYDCYSEPSQQQGAVATSQPSSASVVAAAGSGDARKRPYMHFLTESPVRSLPLALLMSESHKSRFADKWCVCVFLAGSVPSGRSAVRLQRERARRWLRNRRQEALLVSPRHSPSTHHPHTHTPTYVFVHGTLYVSFQVFIPHII